MSGWIRGVLLKNLSLKVVSLVLAVVIYVLVRPAGTGRSTRPAGHRERAAAAQWPDAARAATASDGPLPADAAVRARRQAPASRATAASDGSVPAEAAAVGPSSAPTSRPARRAVR